MPNPDIEEKRRAAREVIDVLEEISLLLVCKTSLRIQTALIVALEYRLGPKHSVDMCLLDREWNQS